MNYETLETICRVLADRINILEAELHDEREFETCSVLDMCCRIYPLKVEGSELLVYPGVGEYIPLNDLSRSYMAMMNKQSSLYVQIDDLRKGNEALNIMLNNVREEKEALRQQNINNDDIIHMLQKRLREADLDDRIDGTPIELPNIDSDDEMIVTDEDRSYGPRHRSKK